MQHEKRKNGDQPPIDAARHDVRCAPFWFAKMPPADIEPVIVGERRPACRALQTTPLVGNGLDV
jgi:hypothetical protein